MRPRHLVFLAAALSYGFAATAQSGNLDFSINGQPVSMPLTTPVLIDGQAATLADIRNLPNGMQAEWSSTAGTHAPLVATPVFSFSLIGPVTGNTPLTVLGQSVTVTADSALSGVSLPINLPLGTPMVVSGLVDANGSTLATLVERRAQAGNSFLLTGPVQAVNAAGSTLLVGSQLVSYQGVAFAGCAAALPVVGEFVSVRAAAVPNLPPGAVLSGISSARCVNLLPPGTAGATGFLQGLVSAVPSTARFEIGALGINLSAATQYVFGAIDDLDPGVAVSVEGAYVDAQTFAADVVTFVRPVVRFQAPLTPANVVPGQSLRLLGVLIRHTTQVRDEDGILGNGLAQSRQVEARGYVDRLGRAYATRVRDRGNANAGSVRLRGPVQTIARPLLTIQGLTVDTTGATFSDELGAPMTSPAFFQAVAVGHEVDVGGASYAAATATLSGGAIVWIGAEPVPPPPASRAAAAAAINAGTAGGYSIVSPLFVDGFEG